MYISRVVIRNFRNFELCDVPLQPTMNCLVGVNGAGKSNFLEAVRLCIDREFSSGNRSLNAEDFHKQSGPTHAAQILISIEFSEISSSTNSFAIVQSWLIDNGSKARLTFRFIPKRPVRDAIIDEKRSGEDLTIEDYQSIITGGNEDDPTTIDWQDQYGQSVKDSDLQSFQVMALQALRDVTRDMRLQRTSPLQRLIAATGLTFEQQKSIVAILANANTQIKLMPELGSLAQSIAAAYRQVGGVSATQDITIGVADPTFRAFLRSLNVLLSDASISEYDMQRNSLGSNNLIYTGMILELLRRRVAKNGTGGELLIIEEPEAHLHPQAQRAIVSAVKSEPYQTIISTHSPVVANYVGISSLLAFDRTATGETRVLQISQALTEDQRNDLDRYLDPHRGSLLFAERVLLVEGAAEEILLPILAKAAGVNVDWSHITVVPVNGTHFASFEALFGEHGLRKRCATIHDGDRNRIDGKLSAMLDSGANVEPVTTDHYVRRFSNLTTFEIALAQPQTITYIADAIHKAGLPAASARLRKLVIGSTPKWEVVQLQVLRASVRIGKARFAQYLATEIVDAGYCPQYITDALNWIQLP